MLGTALWSFLHRTAGVAARKRAEKSARGGGGIQNDVQVKNDVEVKNTSPPSESGEAHFTDTFVFFFPVSCTAPGAPGATHGVVALTCGPKG